MMQITSFLGTLTLLRGHNFQVLRRAGNQLSWRIWGHYMGKLKLVHIIETYDNLAWGSVGYLVQPVTQNRTKLYITAGCTGSCSIKFSVSLWMEIPQGLWALAAGSYHHHCDFLISSVNFHFCNVVG